MTNQVSCSKCHESRYSINSSAIDLNTGKKVGIGSLIGGLVLGAIGILSILAGLSPILYPDPKNPKWSGIGFIVFGFFLLSSGIALFTKFINKKRIKLNKYVCNNCGYQWNLLDRIGGETAIRDLTNRLKNENKTMRQNAATALLFIADARSKEALAQALDDEDDLVRTRAIFALGKIGEPDVIEFLIKELQNEKNDIREATLAAISSIVMHHHFKHMKKGISRIRDIEKERLLVEPLIRVLKNEDEQLNFRIMAAELLGELDDKRAKEALAQAENDKKRAIRSIAKSMLKTIHENTKEKNN